MTKRKLVIIGISTGGPKTLRTLFSGLPKLNGSIVIVQHMLKCGNDGLRMTLDRVTEMNVKIANENDNLEAGTVYIAPSEIHLELCDNQRVQFSNGPKVCFVKPSVDVTMKSTTKNNEDTIIGIIMTGMGKDGADGIGHIKSIGGTTFAQDEETSVIWGMPKVAINNGHIDSVLSPEQIREKLILKLGLLNG